MFERGKKDEMTTGETESREPAGWGARTALSGGSGRSTGETAVIGRSIKINGDLRGDEDLRIEGDVSGTVELKNSSLTIGKEGKIKADVYAKSVIVDGITEGDLYASERIAVRANAQVIGNITAPRVAIEEGAKFKGSVEMDKEAVERALGKAGVAPQPKPAVAERPAKAPETKPSEAKVGTPVKEAVSN